MIASTMRSCMMASSSASISSAQGRRIPSWGLHQHVGARPRTHRKVSCAALATEALQLKRELLEAIEDGKREMRTGKLTPEVEAIVERIRSAAAAAPAQLRPGMIDGRFVGLLNTTNYLDAESNSTLGTLTFQQFHPRDLKVKSDEAEVVSGVDAPDQYQTNTYFTVLEGEGQGLRGMQSALGRYELDAEKGHRQVVYFTAIRIAPVGAGAGELARWLAVFRDANPGMGENGVATIEFPQRVKGTRDFILVDEDIQVTEGNRRSLVVIKRRQ